jgi:hypothetical protein
MGAFAQAHQLGHVSDFVVAATILPLGTIVAGAIGTFY